jgi:predicted Zn-dependent protease
MSQYPDYPLTMPGTMPPNPENRSVLRGINETLNQVESMISAGHWDAAIEWVTSILEDDPDNSEALFARSQLYSYKWDEENLSGQDATRLVELQPDSIWGYIALVDSWLNYPTVDEEGSVDAAVAAIEQAYALEPDNPYVLWRYAILNDEELRGERLLAAEELGANGYRFIYTMAEYLHQSGEFSRAIPYWEVFARYAEQGTYFNDEATWYLMQALIRSDNPYPGFEFLLQSNIYVTADDGETFGNMAYIAFQAWQYDEAQEWADTALAFSSDAYAATYVLGQLAYWRDGDADAATEQLMTIADEDGYFRLIVFNTLADPALESARILVDAGRDEDAIEYYTLVIEDLQYYPFLYEERADTYLRLDDTAAARADLQEAFNLETDPDQKAY